jgi:hypothetical protein
MMPHKPAPRANAELLLQIRSVARHATQLPSQDGVFCII